MNADPSRPQQDQDDLSTSHLAPTAAEQDPSAVETTDSDLQDEMAQFDALLDQHLPGAGEPPARGEVIEVPVVSVGADMVLVDIGGKAEASVPADEFAKKSDGTPDVEIGQVIPVVRLGKNSDGSPKLSFREARTRAAEDGIRKAQEANEPVRGRVTATVKGGLMVDIGLPAFMPASQVDLFKIPDLNSMVGKEIEAYVIEFDSRRRRAVISRRRLLVEQREKERNAVLDHIEAGQMIDGRVKSALDFGIFIELGVIDGFIPREEVSWDRGTHPSDIVKAGDTIAVKVLKIDRASGKVTLSRKRMTPDPWETIEERYAVGNRVRGRVIAIQNYGVFVHIEEGVTGMIHASDLSWSPGNKKPNEFTKVGEEVEALVLEVNKEQKRMSLGLKQLGANPWEDAPKKYPRGSRVKGTVTSMTNYGVFVRLDEFIEGMIHISDLSWEKRVNHPKEVLKAGEEIEAVVLKLDPEQKRISLGLKQTGESPFRAYLKKHPVGTVVTGKVTRFAPFGAFVELAPSLEGLIHISHIDEKRVELPENALSVGEEVQVKIIKADEKNQKISLSRKEALKQAERDSIRQYLRKSDSSTAISTFGEALSRAREDAKKEGEEDAPPAPEPEPEPEEH